MINYEAVAHLLQMVLDHPEQCRADGIEAVARRVRINDETVELADNLAHWKRKLRDSEDT